MLGTFSLRFTQIIARGRVPKGARLRHHFLSPPGCTEDKIETLKKKKRSGYLCQLLAAARLKPLHKFCWLTGLLAGTTLMT